MGFGSALLDMLFPPKCAFCGRVTELTENGVCPECMKSLPWSSPRDRKADFVRSVTAPLYYEGDVRESLLRFKERFDAASRRCGKRQFLTYYFIAAHPGCTEGDMRELKRFAPGVKALPEWFSNALWEF